MALLDTAINLRELPESKKNFGPLPDGEYRASISRAEIKKTKSGTGQYISICYDILGPTHQGRKVFGNINIRNESAAAEEIGRQQLGDLTRSIGLTHLLTDTDQLIGGTCIIKLAVRKSEQYGDGNDIKGYKTANTQSLPKPGAPQPLEPNAKYVGDNSPPWAKK